MNEPRIHLEMVAQSPSGRMDVDALVAAVTHNLDDWKVGREGCLSTFFHDVFGFHKGNDDPLKSVSSGEGTTATRKKRLASPMVRPSASRIIVPNIPTLNWSWTRTLLS